MKRGKLHIDIGASLYSLIMLLLLYIVLKCIMIDFNNKQDIEI